MVYGLNGLGLGKGDEHPPTLQQGHGTLYLLPGGEGAKTKVLGLPARRLRNRRFGRFDTTPAREKQNKDRQISRRVQRSALQVICCSLHIVYSRRKTV